MPHSWIAGTLFDMAMYAERHGLHQLQLELCAAMTTAMLAPGSRASEALRPRTNTTVVELPSDTNITRLSDYRAASI